MASDWDFKVTTDDFDAVAGALPALTESLGSLARLWDPLADHATYMLILPGPTKVDLLFDQPSEKRPPYVVTGETLAAIDAHFWDWTLWLLSKHLASKHELVGRELEKMGDFILAPMGIREAPDDLGAAVAAYLSARDSLEARFGVNVPRALGEEVQRLVREYL